MRNKSAFTLVELIVVITILSILWTIAFISLQWFSRDARNSKVNSDLRSLASIVEVAQAGW
jgi:prepilin-type N-terminal cleavage/methylation domain-containing protein